MTNPNDLRVIKTRKNIEDSFIRLLERRNFSMITVQDILDEALINRKTFYRYYRDKYDLAEQIIRGFYGKLERLFLERSDRDFTTPETATETARRAYRMLYDDRRAILALWDVKTNEIDFYTMLQNLMQLKYKEIMENDDLPSTDIELESYLTSVIMLHTLKYMLESGREFTPEEMLQNFREIYAFLTAGMEE